MYGMHAWCNKGRHKRNCISRPVPIVSNAGICCFSTLVIVKSIVIATAIRIPCYLLLKRKGKKCTSDWGFGKSKNQGGVLLKRHLRSWKCVYNCNYTYIYTANWGYAFVCFMFVKEHVPIWIKNILFMAQLFKSILLFCCRLTFLLHIHWNI